MDQVTLRFRCFMPMMLWLPLLASCMPRPLQVAAKVETAKVEQGPESVAPAPFAITSARPSIRFELCDHGLPKTGMWKCDPIFVDFNKDGMLDLAGIARKGDGAHVWLGNGKGEWSDHSVGLKAKSSCGGGVAFGDINKDGMLDLAQADHCYGVAVHLGDASGNWKSATTGLYPAELAKTQGEADELRGGEDIDVGDLNGDGDLDLVTGSTEQGGVMVYLGDGTGKNWSVLDAGLPRKGAANRVVFADVNGDQKLDILASYAPGPRVWIGDGKGGLIESSRGLPTPLIGGLYRGLAVGDVNKDGRLDFAVANWVNGPEVYLQAADGSWEKTPDVFPQMQGGAAGLALGDIDGDGHLDLAVSGRLTRNVGHVYGVHILYSNGKGGWNWEQESGLPESGLAFTWGVALADVNGDGVLDVAAGSGGVVASTDVREPSISTRLPVWCSKRVSSGQGAKP